MVEIYWLWQALKAFFSKETLAVMLAFTTLIMGANIIFHLNVVICVLLLGGVVAALFGFYAGYEWHIIETEGRN